MGTTTCGVGNCERTIDNCVNGAPSICVPGAPAPEVCNSFDNDCNGMIDESLGMSECGLGACHNVVPNCAHGFPVPCVPGVARPETCNGIDDNCDGVIDNDCREPTPEPVPDAASAVDVIDATIAIHVVAIRVATMLCACLVVPARTVRVSVDEVSRT